MTIVGFNFNKIDVKRESTGSGKIGVKNNVAIKNIEETDLSMGKDKQKALKFVFEFSSKYEPKIGNILLGGDLLFIEDPKKLKEIQEGWKKTKKLPNEIMPNVLNTILARANILALNLSQEVNLPPPIPLPKVQIGGQGNKKEGQYIG